MVVHNPAVFIHNFFLVVLQVSDVTFHGFVFVHDLGVLIPDLFDFFLHIVMLLLHFGRHGRHG